MKPKKSNSFRSSLTAIISTLTFSGLAIPSLFATTYYWDNDGTTAGFGSADGTWAAPTIGNSSQGWSEDVAGTTEPVNVTTTTSDGVFFGTGANGLGSGSVTVSGTVDINQVTFGLSTGAVTLSGGTIALGGSGPFMRFNNSGNTISSALTLDADTSILMGTQSALLLNLDGAIGGAGNLTFTTPTTSFNNANQAITLGAASTYTGNTLITVGNQNNRLLITLGVDDALPASTVLTFDGGIGSGSGRSLFLDLNGFDQTLAGLTNILRTARAQQVFSNGGPSTLTINSVEDHSFGGSTNFNFNGTARTQRTQITGDVSLVKTGSGTFTLIQSHPYTGTTLVSGGRLQGVVGGAIANSAVTLDASGTYGVSITNNTNSWTCGSLTTAGTGTLEFDFGAITPSDTVSPLIVTAGAGGRTGVADFAAASPTVRIVSDSTLPSGTYPLMTWDSINGTAPTGANLTLSNSVGIAADLQVSGNTLNLVITSTSATIVKADNTDDLNSGSSWVGGTAPVPGDTAKWDSTVTSANSTVLGTDLNWAGIIIENPTGPVTIGGDNTLTLGVGSAATEIDLSSAHTADLTLNCQLALGDSNIWDVATGRTLTIAGAVSGNFPLTLQGSGTVRLGASDVFPDGSDAGNITVDATLDLNGNSDTINGLTGNGIVDTSSAGASPTLTVDGNNQNSTFDGVLQNSGTSATLNIEKKGIGTLTLGGANTYDGSTTVSGGTLRVTNLSALGNTSGLTIAGDATFIPGLDGLTIGAPITLGSSGSNATINAPTSGSGGGVVNTLTANGKISGDGDLTFNGSAGNNSYGTIILGAANDYAGATFIDCSANGATVFVSNGITNALPSTTVLTLDGGNGAGTGRTLMYDLNGFDQTLAGLTNVKGLPLRRQVVNNTGAPATLTLNSSGDYSFGGRVTTTSTTSANIQGAISLVKSGGGTFTLIESHTFTGSTAVNGGTLGLDGASLTSDVTVAGGASMEFTLDAPATTSGTLGLGSGTVKIIGTVDNASDYQLMTATGGITGSLTLDIGIANYALELRNGDTELWLAYNPSSGGYNAWASLNGAEADLDGDHDGDGVSNGVEYFIGGPNGNTTGFTALPGVENTGGTLSVTFTRAADYVGVYGTDFVVETSTTLTNPWTTETEGVNITITGNDVKYTFPAGAKNFARLKVTGP